MAADKIDISKSEFILSQPPDLHAVDVVVNARDAGLAIDLPLVYTVRTRASARRHAPSPSAETSPVTARGPALPSRRRAAGASKADSNRAQTNLTPKEVAEPPKSAAPRLAKEVAAPAKSAAPKPAVASASPKPAVAPPSSKPAVASAHNAPRSNKAKRRPAAKKASARVFAKPEPLPSVSMTNDAPFVSMRNDEELLMILAAEVGLGRAIDILQAERARVMAIFGG
jgi:hypothetical protein